VADFFLQASLTMTLSAKLHQNDGAIIVLTLLCRTLLCSMGPVLYKRFIPFTGTLEGDAAGTSAPTTANGRINH
jgi:hypothetical protein